MRNCSTILVLATLIGMVVALALASPVPSAIPRPAASRGVQVGSVAMRLRGGGVLKSIADSLGWKRDKIGSKELGCGPLPQAKAQSRHTEEGKKKKKKHDGEAMTRSHSFTIPDVANQR